MLIFRVKGDESQILQISKDDVLWRYFAAFGYATVALTVIATLGILLSVFAENSIGPIVATVCIVLFFTIVSNINVPVIDKHVKPWLFTSYMVGWKGFFYIGIDNDGQPVKGTLENLASHQKQSAYFNCTYWNLSWYCILFISKKRYSILNELYV